jgi:hypothetical protein
VIPDRAVARLSAVLAPYTRSARGCASTHHARPRRPPLTSPRFAPGRRRPPAPRRDRDRYVLDRIPELLAADPRRTGAPTPAVGVRPGPTGDTRSGAEVPLLGDDGPALSARPPVYLASAPRSLPSTCRVLHVARVHLPRRGIPTVRGTHRTSRTSDPIRDGPGDVQGADMTQLGYPAHLADPRRRRAVSSRGGAESGPEPGRGRTRASGRGRRGPAPGHWYPPSTLSTRLSPTRRLRCLRLSTLFLFPGRDLPAVSPRPEVAPVSGDRDPCGGDTSA